MRSYKALCIPTDRTMSLHVVKDAFDEKVNKKTKRKVRDSTNAKVLKK